MSEPLNRKTEMERLDQESRARGFIEYPKMLHKTDGSNVTVNNKAEEEAALRSGDVHPTPALAIAEKEKREEAERKKTAVKAGAEAAGKGGGKAGDKGSNPQE